MAAEDEQDERLSTPQKVVAGAALGVAVPAAVGVARKLLSSGSGDEDDSDDGDDDDGDVASSEPTSRERTGSTSSGRSSRSSTRSKSTTKSRSSSGSKKSTATKSASTRSTGSNRTREQLYRTATRLKIDGRSSMTKAQLERAIAKAKGK